MKPIVTAMSAMLISDINRADATKKETPRIASPPMSAGDPPHFLP